MNAIFELLQILRDFPKRTQVRAFIKEKQRQEKNQDGAASVNQHATKKRKASGDEETEEYDFSKRSMAAEKEEVAIQEGRPVALKSNSNSEATAQKSNPAANTSRQPPLPGQTPKKKKRKKKTKKRKAASEASSNKDSSAHASTSVTAGHFDDDGWYVFDNPIEVQLHTMRDGDGKLYRCWFDRKGNLAGKSIISEDAEFT